jgi:hypothetical protein
LDKKKRARFKRNILSQKKMLDYAYNCQLWKENTDVFKAAKILSVRAPELILQAKPR